MNPLQELLARWPDAQLLLCNSDKTPIKGKPWKDVHRKLGECLNHQAAGGLIGLVPGTVGYAVVDADCQMPLPLPSGHKSACDALCRPQPLALELNYPASYVIPSRRQLRAHLWYAVTGFTGNAKWQYSAVYGNTMHTLSGDLRCHNGYVILWPGWEVILSAPAPDAVPLSAVLDDPNFHLGSALAGPKPDPTPLPTLLQRSLI